MRSQLSLEVMRPPEAAQWDEALAEAGPHDFHHLAAYHKLAEIRGEGEGYLLVMRTQRATIAFPLLLRKINIPSVVDASEGLKDATSVYGYAGPVASGDVDEEDLKQFHREVQAFFEQERVVTAFSRLHPLLNQGPLLQDYGQVVESGVTLSVDLTVPPDLQFARYRKIYRREIRQLRKMGLTCEIVGREDLEECFNIYNQTMDRVHAEPTYYFGRDYFDFLLSEMPGVFHLFACKVDGEIACAGLVGLCNGIIQQHLACTSAKHLHLSPSRLMYDVVREWGNERGARFYHLGGGVGGTRDSLYRFKAGFGGDEYKFTTWQHVVNGADYHELCQAITHIPGSTVDASYFPVYRQPLHVAVSERSAHK